MAVRTLVVVNPQSRSGGTGRRWAEVERKLRDALGPLDVERTRAPRDAERIAREGVRAGIERLVVAGGDGTLSEVVTGLLSAELGSYAAVGILPLGTGGDFARTLDAPRDLDAAIQRLAEGRTRRIDIGRLTYRATGAAPGERPATAYFANVASFGISGLVDELVNAGTKVFGGRVSFLVGTIRALLRYRSEVVSIRVDGELVHQGPLVLAAAANGQFFGGGMRVAPNARLDDGQLDVVIVPDTSKLRLLAKLPLIYRGAHVDEPETFTGRGRVIEAEAPAGTMTLDIDGEPLGTLPARFEILPGALEFFGTS